MTIRLFVFPALTLLISFLWAGEPSVPASDVRVSDKEGAYPEHLTGAYSGGFGEETCRSCHFDYDLNPDDGRLVVSGIPGRISGGENIEIQIRLERKELGRAGFQLSARYSDGKQAGHFDPGADDRIMFSKAVPDTLEYIQHSQRGSEPLSEHKTSWSLTWVAPDSLAGPVVFNIAANAGNGDQSEFGDFIYAEEIKVDGEN